MICSICKKNPAVIFSSKIENNERKMEGLCIDCAKKLGINTDEVLAEQNKAFMQSQAQDMNKQLEGLFKGLTENLGDLEGLELGTFPFNSQDDNSDDEEFNDNPPKILAGAIPLMFSKNAQSETSNSSINNTVTTKKKV